MKKVRLIASKLNVEIEATNMIVIYVIEGDDSEGAVIQENRQQEVRNGEKR